MEKYRKKPVVIEAVQWTGKNITEVLDFMDWRNAAHDASHPGGQVKEIAASGLAHGFACCLVFAHG